MGTLSKDFKYDLKAQETFLNSPLGKAIYKLDEELGKAGKTLNLELTGGFSMLMYGFRDLDKYTDLDYVGPALDPEVAKMVAKIGHEYGIEEDWVNNGQMLDGSSKEDYEAATGELHFRPALELNNLKISALDEMDLLRTKIISLDTSISGVSLGGDFTREKDLKDIKSLIADMRINTDVLDDMFVDYVDCYETFDVIDSFLYCGLDEALDVIHSLSENTENLEDAIELPIEEAKADNSRGALDMVSALQSGNLLGFLQGKMSGSSLDDIEDPDIDDLDIGNER